MAENIGSVKMIKNNVHLLDEDCWQIIFKRLDYSHDIASVSLVCKGFLCITNRLRLSLRISKLTAHLLPKLLERFNQVKSIEIISNFHQECNDIICQIARSGLKHFEALEVPEMSLFPKEGLQELAMNTNGLKKLKFPQTLFHHLRDDDLVALGDWFPTLEELSICGSSSVTDSGLDVLASKLKRLTKLRLYDFSKITDQSIVSIASNCANLTDFGICNCHLVTEKGIGYLLRHCSMLTSLSLQLSGESLYNVEYHFTIANSIPYARNLEDIRFCGMPIPDEVLCSIAKSCPMVKKMYVDDYNNSSTNSFTLQGLTVLLRSFSSLRDFTLGTPKNSDKSMLEISQHIRGLTQLDISECSMLTTATFFILTKTCTSLKSLKMRGTRDGTLENSKVDLHHNYQLTELRLYKGSINSQTLVSFVSVAPNLQRLSIFCFSEALMNDGIVECLKICPKLWYLDVTRLNISNFMGPNEESKLKLKCIQSCHTNINDEALEAIGKRCPDLEKLDIERCKFVTSNGLKLMVSKCEKLREINMSSCPNLSSNLLELVKSRPSLKKIITPSGSVRGAMQRDFFLRKGCHVTE